MLSQANLNTFNLVQLLQRLAFTTKGRTGKTSKLLFRLSSVILAGSIYFYLKIFNVQTRFHCHFILYLDNKTKINRKLKSGIHKLNYDFCKIIYKNHIS